MRSYQTAAKPSRTPQKSTEPKGVRSRSPLRLTDEEKGEIPVGCFYINWHKGNRTGRKGKGMERHVWYGYMVKRNAKDPGG